jgi:hypothetical protein
MDRNVFPSLSRNSLLFSWVPKEIRMIYIVARAVNKKLPLRGWLTTSEISCSGCTMKQNVLAFPTYYHVYMKKVRKYKLNISNNINTRFFNRKFLTTSIQ